MARNVRVTEEESTPPRLTLLSALAAFFLVGGAAVLGLFGSGAYDKMTGATIKNHADPISYAAVSDALVNSNVVKPVLVPTNSTPAKVDALPADAVAVPAWRAVEDTNTAAPDSSSGTGNNGLIQTLIKGKQENSGSDSSDSGAVCYPKNGYEVVKMVNGSASPCRVVVLTKPFTYGYKIERQINVTQPKIIVGNPMAMPMINCSRKIERCFDVQPGGRLDTRFLIMIRGGGRYLDDNGNFNLNLGTHVLVRAGGEFTATGVLFRERNMTLQSFQKEVENTISKNFLYFNINFGQYVSVMGGNLFLQGCFFLRVRPYGAGYLTNFSLGREVFVLAGNAVFTGVNNILYTLFSSYPFVSGKVLCVLGGTATMIGGSSVYATGLQLQLGWGIDLACLGGALVTVGWSYAAANGAMLRVGGGQFGVGGGTVFHTGFNMARAFAAFAFFGAGVTHVNGGGTITYIGGSYASFLVASIYAGIGGWVFQGSGSSTFLAVPQSRYAVVHNLYGSGGVFWMGAGILTLIANPQYASYLVYYQVGAGSDTFLGAGYLISIRNIRFYFNLVYGHTGIGNQMYVGAGAAIFINTFSNYRRLKYWRNWDYFYTVGGYAWKLKKTDTYGLHSTIKMTKNTITVETYDKADHTWKYKTCVKGYNKTGCPTTAYKPLKVPTLAKPTVYVRMMQEAAEWLTEAIAASGGLEPYQENKIIMLNSTVYENRAGFPSEAQYQQQGGGGPYNKFMAAQAIADPYPAATIDSVKPGKIAVKEAECFICGVKPGTTADHVDIQGGTCEVHDGCAGTTAEQTMESAQALTDQELGFPGIGFLPKAATMAPPQDEVPKGDLPDLYFLWYDLTVYCRSTNTEVDDASITDNCLSADYVKRILRAYIEMDGLDQGFDMTLSPQNVYGSVESVLGKDDPLLVDLKIAMTPKWNPGCQGWTRYEVQFSTLERALRTQLAGVMDAMVADPTEISQNIVQNFNTTLGEVRPCSVTVEKKLDTRFPSISHMPAFMPSSRQKIGPDVVVSDGASIVPTDEVSPDKTYQIYVQNFPRNSKVNIQLLTGPKDQGPIIATIEDFNDDGVSEVVTWTAPATLDPAQRYYLKAFSERVPALFANSQILRGRR